MILQDIEQLQKLMIERMMIPKEILSTRPKYPTVQEVTFMIIERNTFFKKLYEN